MKVTHFGVDGFPWAHVSDFGGVTSSIGSNTDSNPPLSALNFVQRITANSSNVLLNPIVNFAAGSNVLLTLDQGPLPAQAYPSNTIRIHSTGGGGGTIITANGSNSLAAVVNLVAGTNIALGVSGQNITITNTQAAGGGGGSGSSGALVFLETHTASSSASLDFTTFISSTYDDYMFEIVNILPANNAVDFLFRTGAGSFDSGNNYQYIGYYNGISDALTGTGASATSSIHLANSVRNDASSLTVNGSLKFYGPGSTSSYKGTSSQTQASAVAAGRTYHWTFGGSWQSTSAADRAQFLFSSGNIASGVIRVYGITKS